MKTFLRVIAFLALMGLTMIAGHVMAEKSEYVQWPVVKYQVMKSEPGSVKFLRTSTEGLCPEWLTIKVDSPSYGEYSDLDHMVDGSCVYLFDSVEIGSQWWPLEQVDDISFTDDSQWKPTGILEVQQQEVVEQKTSYTVAQIGSHLVVNRQLAGTTGVESFEMLAYNPEARWHMVTMVYSDSLSGFPLPADLHAIQPMELTATITVEDGTPATLGERDIRGQLIYPSDVMSTMSVAADCPRVVFPSNAYIHRIAVEKTAQLGYTWDSYKPANAHIYANHWVQWIDRASGDNIGQFELHETMGSQGIVLSSSGICPLNETFIPVIRR